MLANGECGTDDESERQDARMRRYLGDDLIHAVANCADDCAEEFSWRHCEACGSTLGGERHGFAVLTE